MAARASATSGNWSDPATWGGVVPVPGDTVTITAGHEVIIDQDVDIGTGTFTPTALFVSGVLKFDLANPAPRTLTIRQVVAVSGTGSRFEVGTPASPVPANKVITIQIGLGSASVGAVCFNTNATSSFISMVGAPRRRRTRLTATAAAAQAVIDVENATGWTIGDELIIGTTSDVRAQTERFTIAGIVGTTVTLSGPLANQHLQFGRVLNVSSNLRIETPVGSSHARFDNRPTVQPPTDDRLFQDVEFRRVGFRSTYSTVRSCGFIDGMNGGALDSLGGRNNVWDDLAVAFPVGVGIQLSSGQGTHLSNTTSCNGTYGVITTAHFSSDITDVETFGCSNAGFGTGAENNIVYARNSSYCNQRGRYYIAAAVAAVSETDSTYGIGPAGPQRNITADISFSAESIVDAVYDNVQFTSTTFMTNQSFLQTGSALALANIGGDPNANVVYGASGYYQQQSTVVRDTVYAVEAVFTNSTDPFVLPLQVFGKAGFPLAVVGYLRKNAAFGSGVALPTVTLSGLGMPTQVWTMTDVNDEWVQFVVAGTPTRSGLADLTVAARAGSGSLYIDTFVVAGTAVNTGDFGLWYRGKPIPIIVSTSLGAADVWSVPLSQVKDTAGSVGERLGKALTLGQFLALKD